MRLLIIINWDRTVSVYADTGVRPFDGVEDTLIGVRNDSTTPISASTVEGPGTYLAGLDGDGICAFALAGCPFGPTSYEGPNTRIVTLALLPHAAEIDFPGGLAGGAFTYFSLEGQLASASLSAHEGHIGGYLVAPDPNLPGRAWSAHWPCGMNTVPVSMAIQTWEGVPVDGS